MQTLMCGVSETKWWYSVRRQFRIHLLSGQDYTLHNKGRVILQYFQCKGGHALYFRLNLGPETRDNHVRHTVSLTQHVSIHRRTWGRTRWSRWWRRDCERWSHMKRRQGQRPNVARAKVRTRENHGITLPVSNPAPPRNNVSGSERPLCLRLGPFYLVYTGSEYSF